MTDRPPLNAHTAANIRRVAMMNAVTYHPDQRCMDINLSAVFHDYDDENEFDAFWYFLREVIEAGATAKLAHIPGGDPHLYARILRKSFEDNDVYGHLRVRTQTVVLRLAELERKYISTPMEIPGGRILHPSTPWEVHITPNVTQIVRN